ncbi:MAG TPA: 50S ribosomal protein L25 [Dehalococcoidales bacterium]|nr:50S ribosomal protein L25 [Dehalococcoidales bacterium]
MEKLKLQASKREIVGKKTRFLRRQGITPTHLFGHDLDSLALQCDTPTLKKTIARAGMTRIIALDIEGDEQPRSVFIREIQKEPRSGELLHVDFYQVIMTEKITADVPIVLIGEAPAMKEKGRTIAHNLTSLALECLPDDLPPQIEVDLSVLEDVEQAIFVRDIVLGSGVTVMDEPDQLVVKVSEVRMEVEEEVVPAEVAAEVEEGAEEAPAEEGKEPGGKAEEKPEE